MITVLSEVVFGIALFLEIRENKPQKKNVILLFVASQIIIALYSYLYFWNRSLLYILYSITAVLCVFISYTDVREKLISAYYCLGMIVIGVLFAILRTDTAFFNPIITGVIFFFLTKLAKKLSKNQIGDGDVYLITAYSVIYGYPLIIKMLFSALFISLLVGLIGVIFKKFTMKTEMPFAPFMLIGSIVFELMQLV